MPVLISPTGVQAVHRDGEVAVGARRGGCWACAGDRDGCQNRANRSRAA
ncbi:hypothetical protein SAMN04488085_108150 [Geodermatophilus ruber]|uniref:Uncharacterized protein n=1 Tax=Geodermatophilus ruber TaxID=504800 RepID=A0A1I4G651_9ACTN|nr:hypothetical protein SAMN04488085_108150 [Geodermatophilus ruber]